MKKKALITILCVLFFLIKITGLNAQFSLQDSAQASIYLEKIDFYQWRNLDTAIIYADSLIDFASRLEWYNMTIETTLKKADLAFYIPDSEMILNGIKAAEKIITDASGKLGDRIKIYEREIKLISSNYYIQIGQPDNAEGLFKSLILDLTSIPNKTKKELNLLVMCYINLGEILDRKGSYRPALDYFHEALSLQSPEDRTRNYIYVANIYSVLGKTKQTIEYAEKAIANLTAKIKTNKLRKRADRLIEAYYTLVEAYLKDGNYEAALTNLTFSLKYHLKEDTFYPRTFERFGWIYSEMKNYKKAISFFKKSLRLRKDLQKVESHFEYANPNKYIGDLYAQKLDHLQALDHYQLAITHLVSGFEHKAYHQNPSLAQVDFKKELLELLGKKTNCLHQLSLETKATNDFASLTQKTSELAMALIDSIRLDYSADADKQFLLEQSYAIYEIGIDQAMRTGNMVRAFNLSEKSKAMVLSEGIHRKKARMLADIGEEERKRIQQIEKQISSNKMKLQKANSEAKIAALRDEIFQLKRDHEAIMEKIKTSSKFMEVLAEDHHYNLADIKTKLQERDLSLIAFFDGANDIFAFYLDATEQALVGKKIPKSKALEEALVDISTNLFQQNDSLYCQQAALIYQELLAPLFGAALPNRLVIIPDGLLGNIPYNALLTASVDFKKHINFGQLPYLFKQISTSFAFSGATLLNQDLRIESLEEQGNLIAYAPSFSESTHQMNQRALNFVDRSGLVDLVFNKKEVEFIEDNFGGTKVMNEAASKAHFLENAPHYRNAHIAAHAHVDRSNSDMSFIAFSDVKDTADYDYKLTVDELYALNLPMDMVVLSACETGAGKAVKGEGIISIARGFAYAGVRSVITTLWKVNDLSTSRLVGHFYQRLSQKEPKDIALQNATKDYLNNKAVDLRRKHPKYWAAFTVIGNTEVIAFGDHSLNMWYWVLAGGLVFMLYFFWRKRSL